MTVLSALVMATIYAMAFAALAMICWNIGLQPAGLVDDGINWWTALGLGTGALLVREVIH